MKDLMKKGIEDLREISDLFQDWETYTEEESKEENLINAIVEAIDNYRYFLQDKVDNADMPDKLGQGFEYQIVTRENAGERMLTQFEKECIDRYKADIREKTIENIDLYKKLLENENEIIKKEKWIKDILESAKEAS